MRSEIYKFLSSVSLFKGLGQASIRNIFDEMHEISVPTNEYIYQSGDPSRFIYIVRYGEVIIRLGSTGEKFRYIGQGEVFSEHSILTKSPHYGSAQAVLDSVLYVIDGNIFLKYAAKDKNLAQNLIGLISGRMKDVLSTGKETSFARRLICHIPVEELNHYHDNLKVIMQSGQVASDAELKLINIKHFEKMTPREVISSLSSLRKKYPILHIYFDEYCDKCEMSSVVKQADKIVLWEKNPNHINENKIKIIQYWKETIRNFDDRCIRMIEDSHALPQQSYSGKNKVFIRKETLSRFLISKTRGLALGGGGARSLAHVGMIKVLEEEGITVDYVSGCSFGAVIGALYARGESYSNILKIMGKYFNPLSKPILVPRIPLISFYRGINIERMLRDAFGSQNIEELQIPFATSAVDLLSGKEHIFDSGPIWEAVLASMSLPGIFPPKRIGNFLLADGGILNNVPDNLIRAKGAGIIISINVSPLEDSGIVELFEPKNLREKFSVRNWWEYFTHPPILKIISRAINLEGRELIRLRTKSMDYFVNYNLNQYSVFDFKKYKKIIFDGEEQFRTYLPDIKKLFLPGQHKKKK
ncbi:MAG: patatin-like phospholipase family protein [Spirochaetia bacterium]|nr:patatin-like phospholipase family protein [Spirochaetia bacterium]